MEKELKKHGLVDVRQLVTSWLKECFGEARHGDYVTTVETHADKGPDAEGKKYRITEMQVLHQRRNYKPDEEQADKWRLALNKIPGMEVRKYQVGNEELKQLALGGPRAGQLIEGKSLMLTIHLFHKQEI